MKEALERQKELDPTIGGTNGTHSRAEELQDSSADDDQQPVEQEKEKPAESEAVETDPTNSKTEEDNMNVK